MRWLFERNQDLEGWVFPPEMEACLCDGSLRLRPAGRPKPFTHFRIPDVRLSYLTWSPLRANSPTLSLPANAARKVRMRVRNTSPETDMVLEWVTSGQPERTCRVRAALSPRHEAWQDIVFHLDDVKWEGALLRFHLSFVKSMGGEVFIESIAITEGEPRVLPPRPDVAGELGIPVIAIPSIRNQDVADAFAVLNAAVVHDPLPCNGMPAPFLAPGADGAGYGRNWWLLDASLAVRPVMWTSFGFCRDMLRGFMAVQRENPDGNMNHEGHVSSRGRPSDLSVIPRWFETAHAAARMSGDRDFADDMYDAMRRYLDWWLSPVKRDPGTGLVTACLEESFTCAYGYDPGQVAAVDTNVAVAVGARLTAEVASWLGRAEECRRARADFVALHDAINRHLWNDRVGCYQNLIIHEQRFHDMLASHMFDPLRLGMAPAGRVSSLLDRLLDPSQFGWMQLGLTTLSRRDPRFKVARGGYDGAAWDGGIWTMRNLPVVDGLRDSGRPDLAAELAWQTIRIFAGNYAEWLEPETGTGQGVSRYSWTAGQWLQAIVEYLFGIEYNGFSRTVRVAPLIPEQLRSATLKIANLRLPVAPDDPFHVIIENGRVTAAGFEHGSSSKIRFLVGQT